MRYVIILTLLVVLINSICQAGLGLILDPGAISAIGLWDAMSYYFVLPAVIFSFPILISVICFKFIFKRFIRLKNSWLKYFVYGLLIMLIISGGLLFWTLTDMQFLDFNYTYTLKNIWINFKGFYLSLVPASLSIPIAIQFIDLRYFSRKKPAI